MKIILDTGKKYSRINQISLNLSIYFRIFLVNSDIALVAQVDRAAVS